MLALAGRSFSGRLTRMISLASGLLLLLACAAVILYDRELVRADLTGDLATAADIIGTSSAAPLVFGDPQAAEEVLEAVGAEESITVAVLYDAQGRVFAQYHRGGALDSQTAPLPAAPSSDGYRFESRQFVMTRVILLDHKTIGSLYLLSDLKGLWARLFRQVCVMGGIMALSLLLSLAISWKLGKVISGPIDRLARAAAEIGGGHVELRVPVESDDELGALARSFNTMLDDLIVTTVSRDSVDNILRSMAESLIVLSRDGVIQTVNQATTSLLGFGEAELIGQPMSRVLEEGLDLERLESGGSLVSLERTYRTKVGERIPVSFSASALRRESRGLQGVVCVAQDVRERRRVLQELRQRETQHAALADLWRQALSLSDAERLMNEVVRRLAVVLEVDYSAVFQMQADGGHLTLRAGHGWRPGVVGQAVDAGLLSMSGYAMVSDGPVAVEDHAAEKRFEMPRHLSEHGVVSGMAVVISGAGRPYGALTVHSRKRRVFTRDDIHFLEVAAQVLAESLTRAVVAESRQRFVAILETASDFVCIATSDGGILYLNQAGRRMIGLGDDEEVSGMTLRDFHPAWANELIDAQALPSILERGAWRGEVALLTRDGREIPVSSAMHAHKAPGGAVQFHSLILRDVTEHKKAEESLRRATDAALEASRAKSEFLANMSHEIRTPMNGIIGMTDLALDTELTRDQRECLATVKSSADSLLGVINDILDFSKIEAGRLDLESIQFLLHECLRETLKSLAPRAHQKGLDLACMIAPDVPPAVHGDPSRLRQVLTNLIGNAIKFTAHGEVVLRVEATRGAGDRVTLRFQVADTGVGIPAAKQQVIFEPFSQADGSTTRKFGGTGLGLSISSQLVHMMGGRIWVESEVGRGSVFHFTVESAVAPAPPARPDRPTVDLRGLRILVLDDNGTNRSILAEMTRGWGMRPLEAAEGPRALAEMHGARAAGDPFHLALVDGQMPIMDGFMFCETVRSDAVLADTPLIVLTSAGMRGDAARCRDLGVEAYLTKPVMGTDLFECIQTVLDSGKEEAPDAAPVTRHSMRESRRALRILLAEDNPVNQAVAVRLIEKRGHSVVVAPDGAVAVARLKEGVFDVVLMDMQMPNMDGLEAVARIRAAEAGTGKRQPIIALTAHAMKGDKERCLAAGMDDYVSKPLSPAALFAAIARLVPQVPQDAPAMDEAAPGIDQDALLARVDGDVELAASVARLFVDLAPGMVEGIRDALSRRSAKDLERAAHKLRGSLQSVAAQEAERTALRLETLGRDGTLDEAAGELEALDSQVTRLLRDLSTVARQRMTT